MQTQTHKCTAPIVHVTAARTTACLLFAAGQLPAPLTYLPPPWPAMSGGAPPFERVVVKLEGGPQATGECPPPFPHPSSHY